MAADGEVTQETDSFRVARRASTPAALDISRVRRLVVLIALALGHLALIWLLRETMAPRVYRYVDAPRIEISFVADNEPVPSLIPPSREPVPSSRAASPDVDTSARTSATSASAPQEMSDDPAAPRLYRPDGGLALSDDLLERLDGAADTAIEFRIANLGEAGMFLRPPPIDYQPTRFDGFWIPNETLLEEWVRKGIQEVSIPIPGSSWRIVCKVSLLAPGGACGILPVTQGTNPIELAPYIPPPNRNH